jgi:hypothetical protein
MSVALYSYNANEERGRTIGCENIRRIEYGYVRLGYPTNDSAHQ